MHDGVKRGDKENLECGRILLCGLIQFYTLFELLSRRVPAPQTIRNLRIDVSKGSRTACGNKTQRPRHSPFLAPWKKNLTTSTCKAAMVTIMPTPIKLKLNIRCSVLLTVLKFRFSRVRKYFCMRETVLN